MTITFGLSDDGQFDLDVTISFTYQRELDGDSNWTRRYEIENVTVESVERVCLYGKPVWDQADQFFKVITKLSHPSGLEYIDMTKKRGEQFLRFAATLLDDTDTKLLEKCEAAITEPD